MCVCWVCLCSKPCIARSIGIRQVWTQTPLILVVERIACGRKDQPSLRSSIELKRKAIQTPSVHTKMFVSFCVLFFSFTVLVEVVHDIYNNHQPHQLPPSSTNKLTLGCFQHALVWANRQQSHKPSHAAEFSRSRLSDNINRQLSLFVQNTTITTLSPPPPPERPLPPYYQKYDTMGWEVSVRACHQLS